MPGQNNDNKLHQERLMGRLIEEIKSNKCDNVDEGLQQVVDRGTIDRGNTQCRHVYSYLSLKSEHITNETKNKPAFAHLLTSF